MASKGISSLDPGFFSFDLQAVLSRDCLDDVESRMAHRSPVGRSVPGSEMHGIILVQGGDPEVKQSANSPSGRGRAGDTTPPEADADRRTVPEGNPAPLARLPDGWYRALDIRGKLRSFVPIVFD